MEEFKGTPGPWEIIERNGEQVVIQSESFQELTCAVSYVSIASELQCQEDANLISAAPELLEELIETHSALCFTADYLGSLRYEKNKAAIAKALGK